MWQDEAAFRAGIRDRLPAAWEHLERLYGAALRRQAASILPPWQDPENAVGEVWLRAVSSAHGYDPAWPPFPWLARICVNACLNQRRGLGRVIRDAVQRRRCVEEAGVRAARTEARESLRGALRRLPQREREAVTLRFLFEVSAAEIAVLFEVQPDAVHQALLRALRRLKRGASAGDLLEQLSSAEAGR